MRTIYRPLHHAHDADEVMFLRVPLFGIVRCRSGMCLLEFLRPLEAKVRFLRLSLVDLDVDPRIAIDVRPPALECLARSDCPGLRVDENHTRLLARVIVE